MLFFSRKYESNNHCYSEKTVVRILVKYAYWNQSNEFIN
jgi:hypothetical protein